MCSSPDVRSTASQWSDGGKATRLNARFATLGAFSLMRTCTDCGTTKPIADFTPIKGTPWTHTRCKPCRAARARAGRPPRAPKSAAPSNVRTCAICGLAKPMDQFTPTNGITYRKKVCRPCRAARAKTNVPSAFASAEAGTGYRTYVRGVRAYKADRFLYPNQVDEDRRLWSVSRLSQCSCA